MMKKLDLLLALAFLIPFTFISCNSDTNTENSGSFGSEEEYAAENSGNNGETSLSDAVKQAEDAIKQLQSEEKTEVMDFRELKSMLPEKLAGMKRVSHAGEKTGALGIVISNAEAKYEDGESRLEVSIIDTGGLAGAAMGMVDWASVEIDRETDDGYERTTTIDGNKAFEKYNRRTRSGELSLIIGERIIVALDGDNMDEDQFREAIEKLDLEKLKRNI